MNSDVDNLGETLLNLRQNLDPWDDALLAAPTSHPRIPQATAFRDTQAVIDGLTRRTNDLRSSVLPPGDDVSLLVIEEQLLEARLKVQWKLLFRFVNGYDYSVLGKLLGTYAQMGREPSTADRHSATLSLLPELLAATSLIQRELSREGWRYAPSALHLARVRLSEPAAVANVIIGESPIRPNLRRQIEQGLARYERTLAELQGNSRSHNHPGLVGTCGGDELYRDLVRVHTGQDRDPDELAEQGRRRLEELASGPRDSQTKGAFASRDALHQHATKVSQQLLIDLHAIIGMGPQTEMQVRAVPADQEQGAPLAYYLPAGAEPATLFVNTGQYSTVTVAEINCVLTHEVAPGHHFQFMQYRTDLPPHRATAWFTSTIEGWGLFAEQLALSLNLIDPDSHRASHRRQNELRAARLIVDPGLHAHGWSRSRASAFLQEAAHLSPEAAGRETERYLEYPGQALAYEAGRQQIAEFLDPSKVDWPKVRAVLREGTLPITAWARLMA